MSKLDDLFGKKKDVVPVLDLSKTYATNKEELKRLMEKVPDYKMRPIKVRLEDIKIKDKDWGFKCPKKEIKYLTKHNGEREKFYTYLDPIPSEMRGVAIMDLCPESIDWKMLTTLRPKSKLDEEFFSKLVELGKLQLKTEQRDKRESLLGPSSNLSPNLLPTQSSLIASVRKVKNKSGIIEKRPVTCLECGEEFCFNRGCSDFNYDMYVRVPIHVPASVKVVGSVTINSLTKKKSKSIEGGKKGKRGKSKGKLKRQDANAGEKPNKSSKKHKSKKNKS